MKQNIFKVMAVVLVVALFSTVLVACGKKPNNPPAKPIPAKASSYVTMDINPAVEFILDQNNIVLSVNAANEDARVMLYGETGIVGVNVEVASKKVAELAVKCGYINGQTGSVSVSIAANAGTTAETELFAKINASVSTASISDTIKLTVENGVDFTLSHELEKIKLANKDKVGYGDTLTVGKFRLVKSAMAYDRNLTMDVAVTMDIEDLSEIVEDSHEYYKDKVNDAFEQIEEAAERAYENLVEGYYDSAYTQVYVERGLGQVGKTNFGALYASLRMAYRTIDDLNEALETIAENPIISENDILTILNNVNPSLDAKAQAVITELKGNMKDLKDADGNITEDSIEAYLNKQFRNLDDETRDLVEEVFEQILDVIEESEENFNVSATTEGAQIKVAIDALNGFFTLNAAITIDPELKSAMEKMSTVDDIEEFLDILEEVIEKVENEMEADMTDAEEARVKELIAEKKTTIANAEAKMKEDLAAARKTAEEAMKVAKEKRLEIGVTIQGGTTNPQA
ncbi:MAG: hypothetical protein RR357_05770 [Clostridia bacterium]